jgi:hypothetical protein
LQTQAVVSQQILRQFGIPQVIGPITSDDLSDKVTYPVSGGSADI